MFAFLGFVVIVIVLGFMCLADKYKIASQNYEYNKPCYNHKRQEELRNLTWHMRNGHTISYHDNGEMGLAIKNFLKLTKNECGIRNMCICPLWENGILTEEEYIIRYIYFSDEYNWDDNSEEFEDYMNKYYYIIYDQHSTLEHVEPAKKNQTFEEIKDRLIEKAKNEYNDLIQTKDLEVYKEYIKAKEYHRDDRFFIKAQCEREGFTYYPSCINAKEGSFSKMLGL